MRKIAFVLGSMILVLVAAGAIFVATFNVNKYRGTIQSELQKPIMRPVALGEMHLGLFPPRFRVQNIAIADEPNFNPDAPFVRARELDVSVRILPLIHKQIEINSISLQRPSVNLIKNQNGAWNFASLGHTDKTSTPSKETQLSVEQLAIQDAQISFWDQAKSKTPALYDHIDVRIQNVGPNEPFTVDASVHLAGSGSEELRLQGGGGPLRDDFLRTSFRGTLDLKQIEVADFLKFLNSPALNGTDGILTGQTRINNDGGKLTAQGETNIQNARVHGMELGYPISAEYDVTDDLAADMIAIRKFTMRLGSTPLEMSGSMNAKTTPAQIDVNLRAVNVSIAEASKLAAASGMALSQGTVVNGEVNLNIQAQGRADKPSLSGTITAKNVQASGKGIAEPVLIQTANLDLTPSEIRSNPFTVVSGGTTLNMQFSLRDYLSPAPILDASARAPSAQLAAILAMAKAYGVTSLEQVEGAGTLNLDMRATGPIKSITGPEITRALNGTISLNFSNVKYSGANISHELASIAGFLGTNTSQSAEGVTNIQKMTGNIVVRNGIAQTSDLQAQLDIGNVGAAGTADLGTEALNMRVTAVLSQASSQQAGGQNVGGFLKTALANNKGELVIPALVTGTFSRPKFSPDLQQIAQMRLKGLVPDLANPGSIAGTLQGLLGGGQQNAAPGQQQAPQRDQPNPVQQVLGLFGKKKQQNQAPRSK